MIKRFDQYHATNENAIPNQLNLFGDDEIAPAKKKVVVKPLDTTAPPKVLHPQQLNIASRIFSGQTIIHTMLDRYKSRPVVLGSSVETIDDAWRFLENSHNRTAAIETTLEQDGVGDYDLTFDSDDISNAIRGMDKDEFYFFCTNFGRLELGYNGSFDELFDEDGDVLDQPAFDEVYHPTSLRDWSEDFAKILVDEEQTNRNTLNDLLGEEPVDRVTRELVGSNPTHYMEMHYNDELVAHFYKLRTKKKKAKTIRLYRAITLPYSYDELQEHEFTGLGIFWSYKKKGAEAHWAGSHKGGGFEVMLIADVNVQNVDWEATLFKSIYGLNSELEVEVREGATLTLVGYSISGGDTNQTRVKLGEYFTQLNMNPEILKTVLAKMDPSRIVMIDQPIEVKV